MPPPVWTLQDLQAFLGTMNYIRPHAGPSYSLAMHPLRELLRPGVEFPPNDLQRKAIDKLKTLVLETHRLAVPDERAAIEAASAWLAGEPPRDLDPLGRGRPAEQG